MPAVHDPAFSLRRRLFPRPSRAPQRAGAATGAASAVPWIIVCGLVALALLLVSPASAAAPDNKDMPPDCAAPAMLAHLDASLPHTTARLRSGEPLIIVAIGSSSTQGVGASSPGFSYPARLEAEFIARLPGQPVHVINKGVAGERVPDMLARFDRDVLALHPDLVIWQVGTNAVLRHDNIVQDESLVRQGIRRLKAADIDLVLMDLQYAPKVLSTPGYEEMLSGLDAVGRLEGAPVFHRFGIMRLWATRSNHDWAAMLSPDQLHMNDWSYGCLARLLVTAILDATRARDVDHDR